MKLICTCGFEISLEGKGTLKEELDKAGLLKSESATCPKCNKGLKGSLD